MIEVFEVSIDQKQSVNKHLIKYKRKPHPSIGGLRFANVEK